ncbi:MAG TPA: Na+/H+ antiporter subunit E [Bacillota bacterium]|nr:Na+/H+ antiporter subunit E [Bacillota bacterium]
MLKLRSIIKFALLLGFWFLLSGSMDRQHVVVGAVVTALLMLFWRSPERRGGRFSLKPLAYGILVALVMAWEILKSAWHVACIVLSGCKVDPQLVWVETPLQSPLSRVIFANCITLTPGTLTVSLEDNRLLVHALTPEFAGGLRDWKVHRMLRKMEEMA